MLDHSKKVQKDGGRKQGRWRKASRMTEGRAGRELGT